MKLMKLIKTYAHFAKVVLWAESPVEEGKRAQLQIGLRDGNPRFIVYSGGKGKESVLNFPMTLIDTVAIMNILKDIASGNKGEMVTARSLGNVYKDNQPTKEVKDIARLHIGKSKEGIVFLSVTMEDRPKIVFPIEPSKYMVFQDRDKQPMDPSYISEKMAVGLANMVLEACTILMINYTEQEYEQGIRTVTEITGNDANGKPTGKPQNKPLQDKFADLDELSL